MTKWPAELKSGRKGFIWGAGVEDIRKKFKKCLQFLLWGEAKLSGKWLCNVWNWLQETLLGFWYYQYFGIKRFYLCFMIYF